MLRVELDHILSEDDAAQKIKDIFTHVEQDGEIYVVMNNGRPVAAIASIDQITGGSEVAQAVTPPFSEPEPQLMETPALPEMPPMPEQDMTLPVPPYASQNPTPEPLMPSLPSIPQYPEAPAQTSFQTPSFPSLNEVPQAPQYPGNSPLSEEPPEDIQGPLIPRIPAIQNPPINLPPLSGTENLQNRPPQS